MSMTLGWPSTSCALKSRPARIGIPQVWKNPGITSWEGAPSRSGIGGTLRSAPRIKRRANAPGEGEITADDRAFETRNRAQRFLNTLREARATGLVGITRLRQRNERNPEMIEPETERLLT